MWRNAVSWCVADLPALVTRRGEGGSYRDAWGYRDSWGYRDAGGPSRWMFAACRWGGARSRRQGGESLHAQGSFGRAGRTPFNPLAARRPPSRSVSVAGTSRAGLRLAIRRARGSGPKGMAGTRERWRAASDMVSIPVAEAQVCLRAAEGRAPRISDGDEVLPGHSPWPLHRNRGSTAPVK